MPYWRSARVDGEAFPLVVTSVAAGMDARTPRADPRVNALAMALAASVAAAVYVAALLGGSLPARGFSVVMFTAAPLFGAIAWVIVRVRARAEQDDAVTGFAAGLGAGLPAMIAQLVSFPLVAAGGGILATSGSSNAALYLLFHLSLSIGAALGLARLGAGPRRTATLLVLIATAALATNLVPLPRLLTGSGKFTGLLVGLEVALAVLAAAAALAWLWQSGRAARPLHTAVAVSLSLSAYDLSLNAIAARRFDPVWWSSLSMRAATYAVLAVTAAAVMLRQLTRAEAYTDEELDRREHQLRESLADTQQLLAVVTRNAQALERALLPSEIMSPGGYAVAARHRTQNDRWTGWFDTIALPSGGVALVVGQVESTSPHAAAAVGVVRGAVRSYALEGHPPAVVLERADAFLRSADHGWAVGLAYAEVIPHTNLVTVALAGAPAVFVLPAGPQWALRPGAALGSGTPVRREERTVLLAAGGWLILHTGLPSATGDASIQSTLTALDGADPETLAAALLAAADPAQPLTILVAQTASVHASTSERTLPAQRISARISRLWICDLFAAWVANGRLADDVATADIAATAQLLATELVSNAVRHSDLSIEVSVALSGDCLRVGVFDSSHRMPLVRRADAEETSGRGLLMVETLASRWGIQAMSHGKQVWFELDVRAPRASTDLSEDELLARFVDDPPGLDGQPAEQA